MATNENLQEAFAGESQANRRYTAFAKKADADGYPVVAKLFRAAADAETIHALREFELAGNVGTTAENLKSAKAGEGYEFQKMYPDFVAAAEAENNRRALASFRNALPVEEVHHGLYSEALKAVETGQDLPDDQIFICTVCGHTVWSEAPDICPVCGAKKDKYTEIE